MPYPFRHALCNEVFEKSDFAESCRAMRKAGYEAIEIAPFTLSEYPATLSAAARRDYRRILREEGLHFVGLHWLMVAPKGLHVTTPDNALREKSWRHIRDLVDLCADLAEDQADKGIMVFGSPKQRTSTGGLGPAEATRNYVDGLASVAGHAEQRGVTILVEALASTDSDIINTLEDCDRIVREIASPAVRTMFDTHNAADETEPHARVVDRHFDVIRHIHVNERDGRHPGTGDYDFRPIFETLARRKYAGWISLEVFDFSAGAETIANDSIRYLQGIIQTVNT
jgi:sugar phosphate isomerase/epimerase